MCVPAASTPPGGGNVKRSSSIRVVRSGMLSGKSRHDKCNRESRRHSHGISPRKRGHKAYFAVGLGSLRRVRGRWSTATGRLVGCVGPSVSSLAVGRRPRDDRTGLTTAIGYGRAMEGRQSCEKFEIEERLEFFTRR